MYDAIIIGGGPAGSAAAILGARKGADVLLLEAGDYPRHKVCGEFISPEALGLLDELLGEFLPLASCQRVVRTRIFIDGVVLESAIDPPAASLSRFDLDSALWSAAACAGVETRLQTPAQAIEGAGPFRVSTRDESFTTRSVINASGRWSRLNDLPAPGKAALGLKAHFFEDDAPPNVDLYFFPGGYCGVSPVSSSEVHGGSLVNVSTVVRNAGNRSLVDIVAQNPKLRQRSRAWRPLTDTITTYPLFFRDPQPVAGKVALVGDAAGFIDPFVGDGIALALRSGVMAVESLVPFWSGERTLAGAVEEYRSAYLRSILPLFRAASRVRRMVALPRVLRWPLAKLFGFAHWTPRLVAATRGRPGQPAKSRSRIAA
jgi:flavin-dependent dehydrogenase